MIHILARLYDASSAKKLKDFIISCRKELKSETNLFWIALQSNVLADLGNVENDFEKALPKMKEELKNEKFIFPTLQANMRNQVNIANITVEQDTGFLSEMLSSIEKLKSGSSLVGEVPLLFKASRWGKKKEVVLKHCFELMNQKVKRMLWFYGTLISSKMLQMTSKE